MFKKVALVIGIILLLYGIYSILLLYRSLTLFSEFNVAIPFITYLYPFIFISIGIILLLIYYRSLNKT